MRKKHSPLRLPLIIKNANVLRCSYLRIVYYTIYGMRRFSGTPSALETDARVVPSLLCVQAVAIAYHSK